MTVAETASSPSRRKAAAVKAAESSDIDHAVISATALACSLSSCGYRSMIAATRSTACSPTTVILIRSPESPRCFRQRRATSTASSLATSLVPTMTTCGG